MSLWLQILVYAAGAGLPSRLSRRYWRTKRPVRAFLSSGAQGICALAAVNILGALPVSLGLNALTGYCCAVWGYPVISLLILKVIMNY